MIQSDPIEKFTATANRLADIASQETLPLFRKNSAIDNKDTEDYDPVTDADRNAEKSMRTLIEEMYPDHGIVGEEFGVSRGSADFRWVFDPVDGTRAFVCGAPSWTTLIALEQSETPILGVIDQPYLGERWIGSNEKTTFINRFGEEVARVSDVEALSEARLSTTDPRAEGYFTQAQAQQFAALAAQARLCRFSFDAYAYGLLAIGQLDLVVEAGLQHFDYAALLPVVEGAGGVVSNWSGEQVGSDGRGEIIAAASQPLLDHVLTVLNA